ncbi:YhdP family protein [Accumulibacter sp.]|uniref:YhdP family protein n=1 Tax=Accumulibacter sp. TaxID=2053492 RepID=UPI0028C4DE2F|nr:YhdP family protein [Accumulibacter sp.]
MRPEELRPALYHRFHFLLPALAHPAAGVIWRLLVRGFWLLYFAFVLLILVLRYVVLPAIEDYRPQIEHHVSELMGLSVSIGQIEARWDGINPDLILSEVVIADTQGQPALAFTRVHGILSWWSIPRLGLRLRLLQIDEPTLQLRRDSDGRFHVAGIAVDLEGGNSDFGDWVLAQKQIRIKGATLIWEDAKRNAPPLILEDVNFGLDNDGRNHRFGLTALPPAELAAKIDLRGDFRGRNFENLDSWSGQAFAQIDYADLAVWRTWIDYPIALPYGRGAVRAWAGFADGGLQDLTADFALDDVNLRLARDLPALELQRMSGRVATRFSAARISVQGQRVELATALPEGQSAASPTHIRLEPTDFQLDWQRQSASDPVRGSATASVLDLGALASLAGYLPLDAGTRKLLIDFAPRGRISQLRAAWVGDAEALQTYSLKGDFDQLALKARASFPGVSGLSGVLDASQNGGSVDLRSQKVNIDLPEVLPESSIAFDTLTAHAKWKMNKGVLDAELSRAEFAGPDAAGLARGSFRSTGEGPGRIDLVATLTRADARAVWRYLPAAINTDARHWVRDALKTGAASEARLVLKGDLANFPFVDRQQGQFLVTVKANDVTVDYGTGWPAITNLDADLRFEGVGMVVDAKRGSILGARLSKTRAEIPDFDAPVSTLKVDGRVEGETSEFLKFITQSPVAARIDHFTDAMSAKGKGHLDIGLVIPLEEARLGDSKIDGNYNFLANEVTVDPALPPLRQVTGRLQFSAKDLRVPEIKATLFGGPIKIKGGAEDGKVQVKVDGSLAVDDLRRNVTLPMLDSVSGSTAYRAVIGVSKRKVELVVDSDLVGIAFNLPAPFAKSTSAAMPLHFDSSAVPASLAPALNELQLAEREHLRASLGNVMSMQLIRRKQGDGKVIERAVMAIGRPLKPLPESGIDVGITARLLDVDYWRNALGTSKKEGYVSGPRVPLSVDLKAGEVVLSGWRYSDVTLAVSGQDPPLWRANLQSREASGALLWDGTGAGKLTARLKEWQLPGKHDRVAEPREPGDALQELPALDIVVDNFVVGVRRFGRLEAQAYNKGGIWRLEKVELLNPSGKLSATGQWQIANGNRTQLDFTLDSSDVGKLLDRLGYAGTVRAGKAGMKGKIGWTGPPEGLDYATLSGDMQLSASNGQFLKLDPGAAGKLLGLISLQGLPRRFTLDFGDVFREGFAFDSINGKMTVENGLMRTDRLQIDGPGARVVMRGQVDLKNETQRLNVNVQPELGGSAALGVAVINPLAGLATLLAHKVLQNPLNKMFSFEYLITGKWDEPKVDRVSGVSDPAVSLPGAEPILPKPNGASNESSQ